MQGKGAHGAWESNFETGNPPEGWESEGQLRNANCEFKKEKTKILFIVGAAFSRDLSAFHNFHDLTI